MPAKIIDLAAERRRRHDAGIGLFAPCALWYAVWQYWVNFYGVKK